MPGHVVVSCSQSSCWTDATVQHHCFLFQQVKQQNSFACLWINCVSRWIDNSVYRTNKSRPNPLGLVINGVCVSDYCIWRDCVVSTAPQWLYLTQVLIRAGWTQGCPTDISWWGELYTFGLAVVLTTTWPHLTVNIL